MVRGRRTRAATTFATNTGHEHDSDLQQQEQQISTIVTRATTAINEVAQSRILNDDQQCYASPKRKESKIDETATINMKTRSSTKYTGEINISTRSNAANINSGSSHANLTKMKNSQQRNLHLHQYEHQQPQKTITKYFAIVDTKQSYRLMNPENKSHSYNGEIYYTNDFHDKNSKFVENNSGENDINIEFDKNIDDEEEDEDCSDESNKNDEINGSMNCSGISIKSQINKHQTIVREPNECFLINEHNTSKLDIEKIRNDNGYLTNSSTSSTSSSSSSNCTKNDVLDKKITQKSLTASYLSNNIATASNNNLFLQEPVLSLNIDKSPNQPSSIKINKTFEVESVFSPVNSNSNCNSICLNGFNKIVTLKSSPKRSVSSDAETIILNNINFNSSCSNYNNNKNNNIINNNNNVGNNDNNNIGVLLNIDNNSNDSGVIIDQNIVINNNNQTNYQQYQKNYDTKYIKQRDELSPSKRRKPTTPHRILCPSPVKHPLVEKCVTSSCSSSSLERTPISNKTNTATFGVVNGAQKRYPKSRRRLNTPQSENSSIALPQLGGVHLSDETLKRISKQQQKLILNSAKNPTAQQNSNNNIKNNQPKLFNSHISPSRQNTQVLYDNISLQNHTAIIENDNSEGREIVEQRKPPVVKSSQQKQPKNHHAHDTLTDYYPVRRSIRKTKTVVKEEMMRTLEQAILENREDGLKVQEFNGKGRGIVTTRKFIRGEFVVEYIGDLIDMNAANEREYKYSLDENAGCYMYYFKHKNQQYCIDATAESGKLGRLVNHSRNGNLITKVVLIKSKPHLVLLARDDIDEGVELTYDYGDRSKEALQHHPWLAL